MEQVGENGERYILETIRIPSQEVLIPMNIPSGTMQISLPAGLVGEVPLRMPSVERQFRVVIVSGRLPALVLIPFHC